jgi:hypothetical protein
VNAVTRAGFGYTTMVVRICVDEHSLRAHLGDHLVEVGEHLPALETVSGNGCSTKL